MDLQKFSSKQAAQVSRVFKSFSHPSRFKVLCRLLEGPCTVRDLQGACGLEQAPTSQFLARLRAEGQIVGARKGNQVFYSLADTRLSELMKVIAKLYGSETQS